MQTRSEYNDPRGATLSYESSPPLPLRVTPDDLLIVAIRNSLTGVQARLGGRIWHDDGSTSELNGLFTPTTDRTLNFFSQQLHHGYLAYAAVTAQAGNPKRGQTLVALQLARPPASAFVPKWFMGQDWLTSQNGIYYPGGRAVNGIEGNGALVEVSVTTPAAGSDWTQTVPTGARWLIHWINAQLLTSATVAARQPMIMVQDAFPLVIMRQTSAATQAASLTVFWDWLPTYPSTGVTIVGSTTTALTFLPYPLILQPGWRINSSTLNLQVGDQWGGITLVVEEWFED